MRHLLNTYIQADPAADLGALGELSLTELIVETGIHDAIARKLNEKGRLSRNAIAEGIIKARREAVMHEWHKSLLHDVVPALIRRWQSKLGVDVAGYFLQRMKTRWGSCNHRAGHIRLNTGLVKKPKDLLEYVLVHEMLHLIAPTHSEQFLALMTRHYPSWREARQELSCR